MKTSEQINELAAALAMAQAIIKPAPKDSTNPHFRSRYADLAAVMEACRAPLATNGIALVQSASTTPERYVRITTRLIHKSGQWIEDSLDLKPSKDDPQGVGSCLTYGRRYLVCAMVGVTADDDDDGNAASNVTNKPKQPSGAQTIQQPVAAQQQSARMFHVKEPKHKEWAEKELTAKNIPQNLHTEILSQLDGKDFKELVNIVKHMMEGL